MACLLSRTVCLALALSALAGCQVLPSGSGERQPRGDRSPAGSPPTASSSADDRRCLAELARDGALFTRAADKRGAPGCVVTGAVDLAALPTDRGPIAVTNAAPLRCETARAFAGWARYGVDRTAREYLGSGVARIETMGTYACRNVAGTSRRSGHARAAAVDIAAFVLEDGRRVSVLGDWDGGTREERRFLRRIQESACKRFGTTLGPDYNAAHRDHFHVETDGGGYCR